MTMKKNKRKSGKAKHPKNLKSPHNTWLKRYPKVFIGIGLLLILAAILLVTIGYVSQARIGLSMLSLFFGIGLVIYVNANSTNKVGYKKAH